MLTSLRKSSSVSSFCMYSLLQVYGIVHRVSFIVHLNVYLVSVCALLCWLRGRGIGLVCTRRFSFHEFYNFLLFKFLILIFFGRLFFLPTTVTHTHTHDPHPQPTTSTHDPRHLATLSHLVHFVQNSSNTQKNPPWACDKGCAEACAERLSALKRGSCFVFTEVCSVVSWTICSQLRTAPPT